MLFPTFVFTNLFTSSTSGPRDVAGLEEPYIKRPYYCCFQRPFTTTRALAGVLSSRTTSKSVHGSSVCIPIYWGSRNWTVHCGSTMPRWYTRHSTRRSTKANKGWTDGSQPFPRSTGDSVVYCDVTERNRVAMSCHRHNVASRHYDGSRRCCYSGVN
jgi:hypothetical protein